MNLNNEMGEELYAVGARPLRQHHTVIWVKLSGI
jgi:hypothetical protein